MGLSNNGVIRVKCFRYNPAEDRESHFETYEVPFREHLSVLNVLEYISRNLDPSLGYVSYCRHGICGECKVKVNGKNVLACKVPATRSLLIEPVSQERVVRDLIISDDKERGK